MPTVSPDGQRIYYRILKGGTSPFLGASELWVVNLTTGKNEPLLPGFAVTGYEISQDGSRVLFPPLILEARIGSGWPPQTERARRAKSRT
jgi:hypothetical protein